ncbi:LOW QUALITY PROTEIN: glutamate receptor ionotropic, kainate 2-like [Panulirus ornatus]|uniref:LOW QUALITY PROTEIN: glutamate receptor ionotropic, kainate 2-like n=1 Tax=Panulirus ornatus TaxID=150431 RepID=UPI003A8C0E0E
MVGVVRPQLVILAVTVSLCVGQLPRPHGKMETLAAAGEAVNESLATVRQTHCSVILFLDGSTSATTVFTAMDKLQAPWGVVVLEAVVDTNLKQTQLIQMVSEARTVRQSSRCVTVVVVSDDPAFLATFAQFSLKGRLLIWSTRLLVVTRLPLPELRDLHKIFAMNNAMLLMVNDATGSPRCVAYVHLPYSTDARQPLRLASWTPARGLILATHLPLFPDKFDKFSSRPKLVVAAEHAEPDVVLVPEASTNSSPLFTGPLINLLNILAKAMNFTYSYVRPPDGAWGIKMDNGSWNGMVGLVGRKEAEFGLGPFDITAPRTEVVDFTRTMITQSVRILGARGRPEVDPWSFLLPLAPLVWAAILVMVLMLPAIVFLLSAWSGQRTTGSTSSSPNILFSYLRIALQQDVPSSPDLWWERLVLGVWTVMTLVLTRSYAGNLMALLAVRHIPQPYQSLNDVLDDPSVTMIWQGGTSYVQYFRSATSGIYREIADSEEERIKYISTFDYYTALDSLVRPGDHVIVTGELYESVLRSQDFSLTGRCDFYISREGYLTALAGMIGQKDSPLLPAMDKRIKAILYSGIYFHWLETYMANSTSCAYPPTKIAVNTSLSLYNIWGMFVVLFGGHVVSVLVLVLESLCAGLFQQVTS